MHKDTGMIVNEKDIPQELRHKFIPVKRDLTKVELANKQIQLYSPCGCGSGKKFKFCCKTNPPPIVKNITTPANEL